MAKTKDPGGRPPRAETASRMYSFRITDEERARWSAAAETAGKTLSEWLRAAAEAAIALASPKRKRS